MVIFFFLIQRSTNIFHSFVIIFRRICKIQEKLFIQYSVQWGQVSFFSV